MAAIKSPDAIEALKADEQIAINAGLTLASAKAAFVAPISVIAPLGALQRPVVQKYRRLAAVNLQTESDFGTAFLFLPVWFGCGALSYFALKNEPGLQKLAAICALAALLAFLMRHTVWPRLVLTALLFASLGAAAAKLETIRYSTVMMGSEVTTRITGRLIHAEEITKGRSRLVIDIMATERPQLKFAPERIRVSARGNFATVPAGSTVTGLVKLFALPGPVQPGGYDFAFESYFDGVGAAGFFLGKPMFAASEKPKSIAENIDILRSELTAHIRAIVPGQTGAVVAALVTGVRGAVAEVDNEALRRSGLAHIMSISGLHLALAAGVVIAAIRLGFAFIPAVANIWPVKKWAATAGIVMAVLYCLLSGGEVATLRSTIMIIVMLGAVLVDRPAITMRNLAIAALILLAIWPHEIAGPGFQMSFAATAGLIAIYRWWARRDSVEKPFQPKLASRIFDGAKIAIMGTVLSSTVAGFATLPFGAFHFERLAPWGTLSNLLALPAVSIVIMPSAVAAMVAMPFGLDGYIWPVMAWGVDFMLWLAHAIAGLGGPDATGPVPLAALSLSTFALVVFCLPQTKMRLLGFIPLIAAGGFMLLRDVPSVLIDENAKLVAFVAGSELAVSSTRPDDFSVKNWQRRTGTTEIVKPNNVAAITTLVATGEGFICAKTLCLGTLPEGLRLAFAKDPETVKKACELADLVVQGFAGPPLQCENSTAVITSGMLARHGAAAIYKDDYPNPQPLHPVGWRDAPITFAQSAAAAYRIKWSYTALERPWQTQRTYARAARDLAPKPRPPKRVFSGTGLQGRV